MKSERCFKRYIQNNMTLFRIYKRKFFRKKFVRVSILIIGLMFTTGFYNDNTSLSIKNSTLEEIIIELGDLDIINNTIYSNGIVSNDHYIIEDNVPKDERGYTTKIGDYDYYVIYVDTERMLSRQTNLRGIVHVIDTIAPSIILKTDTYKIDYGAQVDVNNIATCVDNSECKLSLVENINNKQVGIQNAIIEAVDETGNTSQKEIQIEVKKKKTTTIYSYNKKYSNLNVKNNALNEKLSDEEKNNLKHQIINYALQFVGNPYVYGGTSLTNGTDCSGFTQSVYKHFGYSLPRVAIDQASMGKRVSYSELEVGDIIVYHYSNGGGHVGIYIGNGKMVHAGTSKTGIQVAKIFSGNKTYQRIIY